MVLMASMSSRGKRMDVKYKHSQWCGPTSYNWYYYYTATSWWVVFFFALRVKTSLFKLILNVYLQIHPSSLIVNESLWWRTINYNVATQIFLPMDILHTMTVIDRQYSHYLLNLYYELTILSSSAPLYNLFSVIRWESQWIFEYIDNWSKTLTVTRVDNSVTPL